MKQRYKTLSEQTLLLYNILLTCALQLDLIYTAIITPAQMDYTQNRKLLNCSGSVLLYAAIIAIEKLFAGSWYTDEVMIL